MSTFGNVLATQAGATFVFAMCFGVIDSCPACDFVGERHFVGVRSYVVHECRCGATWTRRTNKQDFKEMALMEKQP